MGAQIELLTPARWPKKPYCSADLANGVCIRSLSSALKRPYIQVNPPHLRVWMIFDVDREGAAFAWESWDRLDLCPPNWTAINPENAFAHLVWGVSAPVLVDSPDMRQAPLRYLCAIEAAYRAVLGADQGYSGLLTKNPFHPRWRVLWGPDTFYDLGELAECVDLSRHIPKRGKNPEEIGLGRNCTLFDDLAKQWAYKKIREYKPLGIQGWNPWQSDCYQWALQRNGDFSVPLDSREVWHVTKSVSKWTWRNMSLEGWRRWVAKTHTSDIQAARGRKSGAARLAASADKRASARLMYVQGQSIRQIAQALGVGRSTVGDWVSGEPNIR